MTWTVIAASVVCMGVIALILWVIQIAIAFSYYGIVDVVKRYRARK